MRPSYTCRFFNLGLVWTVGQNDSHKLETTKFRALRAALGDQLLSGFAQLFVWTDRVQSLTLLAHWSTKELPETSAAFARNLHTMTFFVGGALYEAARAVVTLRRAGLTGRLSDTADWDELWALAKRWLHTRELRAVRNQMAFHADDEVVAAGIEAVDTKDERQPILVSDDRRAISGSYRLGLEILLSGTGITHAGFDQIIGTLAADHSRFADLVSKVFYQTLNDCGAGLPSRPREE